MGASGAKAGFRLACARLVDMHPSPSRHLYHAVSQIELHPLPNQNAYQAVTSPAKLRGQYYTPDALVAMMFEALPLGEEPFIIDPSCGDGRFLRGAVAAVARQFAGAARAALARRWAARIIGLDTNPAAVQEARMALAAAFRKQLGAALPEE